MEKAAIRIPRDFNVAAYFVERNLTSGNADRVALRCEGRTLTYGELAETVRRAGNALRSLGVEMEQRVALLLEDSAEFVACFWGALLIGAVPVPLNTFMRPEDYEHCLNDSRAPVLVIHENLLSAFVGIRGRLRSLRHVVVAGGGAGPVDKSLEGLVASASTSLEPAPTCSDDAAFWLYTSGSTGDPKAAVHLQHAMVHCAEYFGRGVLGLGPDDSVFSASKLFFAYGLGNSMYHPAYVGASAILLRGRPRPETVLEIISRERPSVFFAVPTLYAGMLAVSDPPGRHDPSSLRLCVSAGEPLPAELYRRWKDRFGIEILDGLGTTELLHTFISNRPGRVKPGSSGTLVPGYEVRILVEDGEDAEPGTIGNLAVRGESTFACYWNQRRKTQATISGEWVSTGDKYYRDEEGYYWFCGRSDDMLKVGGMWVSPAEVENVLVAHPAVRECAVTGGADRDGLTKPRAFVVLKSGFAAGPDLENELKLWVKEKLAYYKYPRWIAFMTGLPRTTTGKIQRYKLRDLPVGVGPREDS